MSRGIGKAQERLLLRLLEEGAHPQRLPEASWAQRQKWMVGSLLFAVGDEERLWSDKGRAASHVAITTARRNTQRALASLERRGLVEVWTVARMQEGLRGDAPAPGARMHVHLLTAAGFRVALRLNYEYEQTLDPESLETYQQLCELGAARDRGDAARAQALRRLSIFRNGNTLAPVLWRYGPDDM